MYNMKTILRKNKKLIYVNFFIILIASMLSVSIAYFIQMIINTAASSNWAGLKIIILYSIVFLIAYFVFNF
jgi:hypothetical protein